MFLYAWVCYCLCFVCLGGGGSFFSSELVCYKHVFSWLLCGGASRLGLHGHCVAAQVIWTKALPALLLCYLLSPYFPSLCFFTITKHTHTHKEEATRQYCTTVEDLMSADQTSSSAATDPSSGGSSYQDIVVSDSGGARTILLNRPHKYNAITLQVSSLPE